MCDLLNKFAGSWKDYGDKHGLDTDNKCLEHAIRHSIILVDGVKPSVFDWRRYLHDYPDLQKMFKNGRTVTYSDAICHYLNHGINERRNKYIFGTNKPYVYDFDWKLYDKLNPDVFNPQRNRGDIIGRLLCFRHWCEFGHNEGRRTTEKRILAVNTDASISTNEEVNQHWMNALNNILKTTTFNSVEELLLNLGMDENIGNATQTAVFGLDSEDVSQKKLNICFGFQRLPLPHAKHSGINIICNTIIDKCIDSDIFSNNVNIHGDDHNSDIFFSTYNAFDNTNPTSGCRILFIQDLIYLYNVNVRDVEPRGTKQKDNIDNILKSINPTDYLLFTTNYQINKMIEHLHLYPNINSNNIYLYNLPNRFDHMKSQINIELPNKKYDIVCLCQHSRRKNLDLYNIILQKLPHLKIAVVFSIQWFGSKNVFFENIKKCPNITLYTNLEDAQLIEIYKQSKFCLTLSLDEGFGLHALECSTFGCVSIVTSGISFNELFEDNAIYINNIHDSNDVLRQVVDNVNDTNYIKYSEKLPNIIEKFSLNKSKDAFSKVITKIYNNFNKIKTISVLICLRDANEYVENMKKVYPELERIYKDKFRFEYFIYENNSNDGTKQNIIEFKNTVQGSCTIFSEDIPNLKKYSGISLERGAHVRNMRNRFKQMVGKHDSDYVLYIDADVYFKPELIENLSKYINDDVKMVVSNGICSTVDTSQEHHYDTLAFITLNDITHVETGNSCLNTHCKRCILHRKKRNKEICEENYFDSKTGDTFEIKSGFGCCSLIETAMFNKVTFSNESETVLTLEWPSFCRNIRDNGGRIILSIKNKTVCG